MDKPAASLDAAEEQRVREERAQRYGDFYLGHLNLGRLWRGILSNHLKMDLPEIPAHVVLLMMCASKLNRAAGESAGEPDNDNYADLRVYAQLAAEAKERKEEEQ